VSLVAPYSHGRVGIRRGEGSGIIPPPSMGAGLPGPYVFDAQSARRVPAVGRALQLYAGMCKQMELELVRGGRPVGYTPRLLAAPDPNEGGPWFIQCSVEDYLLNGNALALTTVRGADGWPLACSWLPAAHCYISPYPGPDGYVYSYLGQILPTEDVIHVKRGADRYWPVRGVGVVEEYLDTLDRVAMEEEYERSALAGGAVPSVAVIAPQAQITKEVAEEAKEAWVVKFGGPTREPAILPNGTQVIPLAWSPTDTQLVEARKMSLLDVANMFNLDGYWLGAPVAGMTYRTAGPQYQQILRTSLEPVLVDFEAGWSAAWLPRGSSVRFRRAKLLREDLATTITALVAAVGAGILSIPEAREELGRPPDFPEGPLPAGGPDISGGEAA
jgi:HK97 family phage portal protein